MDRWMSEPEEEQGVVNQTTKQPDQTSNLPLGLLRKVDAFQLHSSEL